MRNIYEITNIDDVKRLFRKHFELQTERDRIALQRDEAHDSIKAMSKQIQDLSIVAPLADVERINYLSQITELNRTIDGFMRLKRGDVMTLNLDRK